MWSNPTVDALEARIKALEEENIATTNALYEIENRLQAQLDALINHTLAPDEIFLPNDVM
jgi:hypothetical protein